MEEIKATDLDLATLEYVHKTLKKDWEKALLQREDAETDHEFNKAQYQLEAIGRAADKILSLIWKIGDAQQEVHA